MYGDPVFIYQILKCCLAEKWSQKTCLWREGEIPRVDNVKVSKKETDMENGGISISLLVLGIIHRAAGIGSCTCTIFFVPSVFQINAIWQRLEFGKAPPKWWICGIVGAKRSIDSECAVLSNARSMKKWYGWWGMWGGFRHKKQIRWNVMCYVGRVFVRHFTTRTCLWLEIFVTLNPSFFAKFCSWLMRRM